MYSNSNSKTSTLNIILSVLNQKNYRRYWRQSQIFTATTRRSTIQEPVAFLKSSSTLTICLILKIRMSSVNSLAAVIPELSVASLEFVKCMWMISLMVTLNVLNRCQRHILCSEKRLSLYQTMTSSLTSKLSFFINQIWHNLQTNRVKISRAKKCYI